MRMKMVCDERTLREVANEFSRSEKGAESPGENSEQLQKVHRQIPWMWMS